MTIKTLISTCIEFEENKSLKNTYFAGDWCFKDKKFIISNKNIFQNVWDNPKKIVRDFSKIKKIHKKFRNSLSFYLYNLHKKKIPRIVWSNLIFVWLSYYLFFYYFKWTTVMNIFKKNPKMKFLDYKTNKIFRHTDTYDFYYDSADSDLFNYFAFKKIILYLKDKKKINIKIVNKSKKIQLRTKVKKIIFKKSLFIFSKKIILFFQKNFLNPNLLIIDGINFRFNFFLNLFSFQFPVPFNNIFEWKNQKRKIKTDSKNIHVKKLKIKGSDFEKFISKNIINDIPKCFTSGFPYLNDLADQVKFNPKIIISGSAHIHNEFAKLWMLKQKYIYKKKLFFISHGGVHHPLSYPYFDYENKMSNYLFEWTYPTNSSKYKLPNTKYTFNLKKRNISKEMITYVGREINSYINRPHPGSISISSSHVIKDLEVIIKHLNKDLKSRILYAPKKEMINFFLTKINKLLKREQILPQKTLDENIKKSKLVICTYAHTAFFDAILSGPTILVYNPKLWKHFKHLDKAYKALKSNQIIFDNPIEAANHINHIWNDIDKWWNKKEVINAKNLFLKQFNLPPKNKLSDIFETIKIFNKI